MNANVFSKLTEEHDVLLPIIVELQAAAEAQDSVALFDELIKGRVALTQELDAHITLEEDSAFSLIEQSVGEEIVTPFRTEHTEIRSLRDEVLSQSDAGVAPFNLCLQLCDLIQAHMQREDMMLFPSAREALDSQVSDIK
jgi:hemerythrin-like domain-containing protein